MRKTIEKLWNGDIDGIENFGKNDTALKEIEIQAYSSFEKLEKLLDAEQLMALEKCFSSFEKCLSETRKSAFCDGYCLGVRMTAEALLSAESFPRD